MAVDLLVVIKMLIFLMEDFGCVTAMPSHHYVGRTGCHIYKTVQIETDLSENGGNP